VLREDGTCGVYRVNLECIGEVQDKIRTCSDTKTNVSWHDWLANDLITPVIHVQSLRKFKGLK